MAFQDLYFPGRIKHASLGSRIGRFSLFSFSLMLLCSACSPCLAQSNQPAVKQISTQLRGFGVPFNINADSSEFIEVHLYVTKDKGQSWQFYDRQQTDGEEFAFRAEADGEYWFALKTLNRDKKLLPEGETKPELKVIVDTVKPTLKFDIESDAAGRVVCSWDARDQYISPASLKIFYRPEVLSPVDGAAIEQAWKQVPIKLDANASDGVYRDRIAWWPEDNARSYEVRIEITDSAGNAAFQVSRVSVPLVAWRNKTQSTAHAGSWTANLFRKKQPAVHPPSQYLRNEFNANGNAVVQPPPGPRQQVAGNPRMVCEGGVCHPLPPLKSLAANTDQRVELIGSQIEYADPPVPDGMETPVAAGQTQQTSLTQTPYPAFSPKSIPWTGKTEDPTGQQDLAVASTRDQYQTPDPSYLPDRAPPGQPDNFNIRSLPPITSRDNVAQSTKQLPGGMVVTESTATRKRSSQPMAEFRANAQPEWAGRGDEPSFASSSQPGFSSQPPNPQASWQNQKFVPSIPTMSSLGNGSPPFPESQSRETNSAPPNQRVAFKKPERTPGRMALSSADFDSMQQVNSRRFNLNYSVDAIDPSGVDRVVLWMTRDGGQSWKSWATDPDSASPFPVEVDEPGVYGFRIVVHSRDGLTGLAPKRGDKADMGIIVDTEAPFAQITSVPYGRGNEAGRLIINWQAQDPQLTLRPVTLAYSANPRGPWTPIERGLRNTGRYVWKVGSQVPEKIYIRLEATDKAGNVGVFQLQNLIDISGLVPRGRIQSVEPMSQD